MINIAAKTVTSILVLTGVGWASYEVLDKKVDKVEIAQTLDEREYQRYEEKIEEAQEIQRTIEQEDALTRSDKLHVRQLQERIRKYERRQDKLK